MTSHANPIHPSDPSVGSQRDATRSSVERLLSCIATPHATGARFSELVGESPKQYVTNWRMHLARSMLEHDDLSVLETATRLGYQSEASFSRAFKRVTGLPPSAARSASVSEPSA